MQIGIFHLMQKRDPSIAPETVLASTLDQTILAEEIGMDTAWLAEHHFSSYSLCPSPLLAAVWLAAHTKRIRMAPGILVLPLYEPLRLIEEFGFADLITGGRVDLGFGAGYQNYEFERFRIPLSEAFERSSEIIDIIEQALEHQAIEYKGKHFSIPACKIAAPALRRPTIYSAGGLGQGASFARRALRRGHVPFAHSGSRPFSQVIVQREAYDRVAKEEDLDPMKIPLGVVRFVFVTDSKDEAKEAAANLLYSHRSATSLRLDTAQFNGTTPKDLPVADEPSIEDIIRDAVIGSPEHCAERMIDEIRTARLSHYACMTSVGSLDPTKVSRSMERLGSRVLPVVRKEVGRPLQDRQLIAASA